MTIFLTQLINGIVLGATFGLIALGYTMVYGIVRLINFAHGEVFMFGAFAALTTFLMLPDTLVGTVSSPKGALIAIPLMLIGAVVVSVLLALLIERLAYRPLRNAPRLAPLITAIGVSIFLQEFVRLYYPKAKAPRPFPNLITGAIEIGDITIQYVSLLVLATTVVLAILLSRFVKSSRMGKAMRATSMDPDTAKLMGVDTDRVIVTTFAIGAALAGVAGLMQGLRFGQIDPKIGFLAGLKSFVAAVLGGIGNIQGAVLGGFCLGILEAMASQYFPGGSQYKNVWAFVALILLLVFKPTGLLGQSERGRA
jgi:branched-chain amino acid transport system permease protein